MAPREDDDRPNEDTNEVRRADLIHTVLEQEQAGLGWYVNTRARRELLQQSQKPDVRISLNDDRTVPVQTYVTRGHVYAAVMDVQSSKRLKVCGEDVANNVNRLVEHGHVAIAHQLPGFQEATYLFESQINDETYEEDLELDVPTDGNWKKEEWRFIHDAFNAHVDEYLLDAATRNGNADIQDMVRFVQSGQLATIQGRSEVPVFLRDKPESAIADVIKFAGELETIVSTHRKRAQRNHNDRDKFYIDLGDLQNALEGHVASFGD